MHYVIVANSKSISKNKLIKYSHESIIIALDGIANHLQKVGFIPNIIIGDFDSIKESTVKFFKKFKVKMIKIDDQNSTDLDKAISYCNQNKAKDITIINALGGDRPDHLIMNLRSLRKHYQPNRRIRILEKQYYLEYFKNRSLKIIGRENDNLAILSFPKARVTTNGLKYEMNNYNLEFGYKESSSNKFKKNLVYIKIKGEVVIMYKLDSDLILL